MGGWLDLPENAAAGLEPLRDIAAEEMRAEEAAIGERAPVSQLLAEQCAGRDGHEDVHGQWPLGRQDVDQQALDLGPGPSGRRGEKTHDGPTGPPGWP